MIIDIILIVLFALMLIYGYTKGCIKIVAKLVSVVVALVLAYFLAGTMGNYIASTDFGQNIQTSVENNVLEKLMYQEQSTLVTILKEKLENYDEQALIYKITEYVFIGIGFIVVFIVIRIVLWIAQKILESIFELPVLNSFNKFGGIIVSGLLFLIEVSIILAIIESMSALTLMSGTINAINSTVITRQLYEHNIFTNLILSKIF